MPTDPHEVIAFVRRLSQGARAVHGWTMKELGQRIGVSPATICRFEGGKLPDAVTFLRFVEWLRKEGRR